jgi:hypothetical protein
MRSVISRYTPFPIWFPPRLQVDRRRDRPSRPIDERGSMRLTRVGFLPRTIFSALICLLSPMWMSECPVPSQARGEVNSGLYKAVHPKKPTSARGPGVRGGVYEKWTLQRPSHHKQGFCKARTPYFSRTANTTGKETFLPFSQRYSVFGERRCMTVIHQDRLRRVMPSRGWGMRAGEQALHYDFAKAPPSQKWVLDKTDHLC